MVQIRTALNNCSGDILGREDLASSSSDSLSLMGNCANVLCREFASRFCDAGQNLFPGSHRQRGGSLLTFRKR